MTDILFFLCFTTTFYLMLYVTAIFTSPFTNPKKHKTMKTNINYQGKEISITLTDQQIKEIHLKLSNRLTIEELNTIEDAEKVLKDCIEHTNYLKSSFLRQKDWNRYCIETICKAANFIDNDYKNWKPDFSNENERKHYPIFRNDGLGLVFYCSYCHDCYFNGPVAYYKNDNTCILISKKLTNLYNSLSNSC